MKRLAASLAIATLLALLLSACADGVVDAGPVQDGDPENDTPTDEDPPDDVDDVEPRPDGGDEADEPEAADEADEPSEGANDSAESTTDDADMTQVRLYFVAPGGGTPARADPFLIAVHREIPATPGIALATLRELVDGPSAADRALIDDISTSVPDDTLVRGVNIDNGLATVDLSREFEAGGGSFSIFSRLAQVIYTTTQFPTVDEVEFMLDGQPVTVFSNEGLEIDGPASRADLVDLLPSIFVDSPATGAEVQGKLRMTGVAAVFEATFQYRLERADGTVLEEGFAMTDNGMGWGSFDVTIDVDVDEEQEGRLTVWEYSAKDGSIQAERVTPLILVP